MASRPWLTVQKMPRRPSCTTAFRKSCRRLELVCHAGGQASEEARSLFIFGLGYTGIAAANYFRHRGWHVVGTARSEEKRDALRAKGFEVYDFAPDEYELLSGKALDALAHATHVLSTIPPSDEEVIEDPVLMAHMRHLGDGAQQYKWLGYISSTSVYGNHDGEWVDEQSEVRATSGKGFVRLMAEHEWLHLFYNYQMPAHIFRCGGIYGPRRSAIESVRQTGLPSRSQQRRERQRYTSRVHVYDICQTVEASMARPNPGAIYNVVDDDPAGRLEVMEYAAQLLGLERMAVAVPATNGAVSSMDEGVARSRERVTTAVTSSQGEESSSDEGAGPAAAEVWHPAPARTGEKRVSNARIKRELGVRLAFPTYREGLAAILRHDMRPFD